MASMHITPEIEKKLKEYEKKFGVEFLPFLADTGDGSVFVGIAGAGVTTCVAGEVQRGALAEYTLDCRRILYPILLASDVRCASIERCVTTAYNCQPLIANSAATNSVTINSVIVKPCSRARALIDVYSLLFVSYCRLLSCRKSYSDDSFVLRLHQMLHFA